VKASRKSRGSIRFIKHLLGFIDKRYIVFRYGARL
jgi:hypothetical protein